MNKNSFEAIAEDDDWTDDAKKVEIVLPQSAGLSKGVRHRRKRGIVYRAAECMNSSRCTDCDCTTFNSKQRVGDERNPPSPDEKEVPMHTMTDRKIKNRVIKKNSSARKIAREEKEALKIVPEARKTEGELQASGVEKLAEDRMFVFDRLAVSIAERKAMPDAILNYSKFKRLDVDQVLPQQVKDSSAGVHGWASASIESWENESPTGPKRSGIDWPPAAEDDRHGERDNTKTIENPPRIEISVDQAVRSRDRVEKSRTQVARTEEKRR